MSGLKRRALNLSDGGLQQRFAVSVAGYISHQISICHGRPLNSKEDKRKMCAKELGYRPMEALRPQTGFAAVTGRFRGPDRMEQAAYLLLRLPEIPAFGVVADKIL